MDKEIMDRIFEPFFTSKGIGKGTGLGLASVYGIIKGHGGYIDVQSKKGKGTLFELYFPSTDKEILKETKDSAELIKGRGTILLVDDEDMVIDVGSDFLEYLGYNVLTASSGKEAIDIYREHMSEIPLVVLDMIMPNMSGGDTYDRLKRIDPEVKVLLSSGYSIDGQAKDILKRGCHGFIQKPFNIKSLSRKVSDILNDEKPASQSEFS
jgi:CheY-like chemotaxis protein